MTMVKATFKEILDTIMHTKGRVIDDHNNSKGCLTLSGLATVKNSGAIVALCDSRYFSLNRVYLDEKGMPHVSREAVAGVIQKDGISLQEGIDKYNEQQRQFNDDMFTIENVTLF